MNVRSKSVAVLMLWATVIFFSGPAGAGMVMDETGRSVTVSDSPSRIIGLTPSLTEILFALGLGDKVVGATEWSDYPEAARAVPEVGSYVSPNLERIAVLNPDLVLVNREGNPPWVVEKLEQAGIPVFVTWPNDPLTLPDSLERIGRVCGVPEAGRVMADELRACYEMIASRLAGVELVPTLLVIGNRPLVSVGAGSFHDRLLQMVRARNVAAEAPGNWPRLDVEFVLQTKPDVVVVSTMERGQNLEQEMRFWREMPGLNGRPEFRVTSISSDLLDRPGPRLARGLETLARIIHPDRFPPTGESTQ